MQARPQLTLSDHSERPCLASGLCQRSGRLVRASGLDGSPPRSAGIAPLTNCPLDWALCKLIGDTPYRESARLGTPDLVVALSLASLLLRLSCEWE